MFLVTIAFQMKKKLVTHAMRQLLELIQQANRGQFHIKNDAVSTGVVLMLIRYQQNAQKLRPQ